MPKIIFDENKEMRSNLESDRRFETLDFRPEKKNQCERFSNFHNDKNHREKRSFKEKPYAPLKKDFSKKPQMKHDDFPQWFACLLFSILGAFATFTPICELSMPFEGRSISMSFTAIDLFKAGFGNSTVFLNLDKFEFYFITVAAFAISFASSVILKEKIADRPYIPVLLGIFVIAGIFISFGSDTVFRLIAENHSICLCIQLVCALMIIILNLIPMKKIIEEKNNNVAKRRTF